MSRRALIVTVICSALFSPVQAQQKWEKRWVYISRNLYVDKNIPQVESIMERAQKAGYNGVLFADYKMCTWWTLGAAGRWKKNAGRIRKKASDLGLEFTACVLPFGYSSSLLSHDVNLAAGMPVRGAILIRRGNHLVPEQTVRVENGSFENYRKHRVRKIKFHDAPGKSSFVDTKIFKHGKASLRFEDVGQASKHGHGRLCVKLKVQPWRQYRIRVWMKTENLSASLLQVIVLAKGRSLQRQYPMAWKNKKRVAASSARNLTSDWIEQRLTFNSLNNTSVLLYAGLWGGKTGKIWWDNLRIDDVPTLNLLRRDTLPLTIVGEDETVYEEGKDFGRIRDPGLGQKPWPGNYDTLHEPPVITVPSKSRIREGQAVRLSCYHATIIHDGQVGCSMDDPNVFDICKEQIKRTRDALSPDGYFMSHDEIRCGGWEPNQEKWFKTSGKLFAYNIKQSFKVVHDGGGGKPVYVWSDMYDPFHNARDKFYLVKSSLKGSWEGLDKRIVIMKWAGGARGRPGLKFFSDRGHKQMIAAYYDGHVKNDHNMWLKASDGIPGIVGVMYTTWRRDYRNLENFASEWWGKGQRPTTDDR